MAPSLLLVIILGAAPSVALYATPTPIPTPTSEPDDEDPHAGNDVIAQRKAKMERLSIGVGKRDTWHLNRYQAFPGYETECGKDQTLVAMDVGFRIKIRPEMCELACTDLHTGKVSQGCQDNCDNRVPNPGLWTAPGPEGVGKCAKVCDKHRDCMGFAIITGFFENCVLKTCDRQHLRLGAEPDGNRWKVWSFIWARDHEFRSDEWWFAGGPMLEDNTTHSPHLGVIVENPTKDYWWKYPWEKPTPTPATPTPTPYIGRQDIEWPMTNYTWMYLGDGKNYSYGDGNNLTEDLYQGSLPFRQMEEEDQIVVPEHHFAAAAALSPEEPSSDKQPPGPTVSSGGLKAYCAPKGVLPCGLAWGNLPKEVTVRGQSYCCLEKALVYPPKPWPMNLLATSSSETNSSAQVAESTQPAAQQEESHISETSVTDEGEIPASAKPHKMWHPLAPKRSAILMGGNTLQQLDSDVPDVPAPTEDTATMEEDEHERQQASTSKSADAENENIA